MAHFQTRPKSQSHTPAKGGASLCQIVALCLLGIVTSITFSTETHAARQIARMVWDIEPTQIAGAPLRGRANLLFLDDNNELVDTIPIGKIGLSFSAFWGSVAYDQFDSTDMLIGGILDLKDLNFIITNRNGLDILTATSTVLGVEVSVSVDVNGIEIIDLGGVQGGRGDRVYLDSPYEVSFVLLSYGDSGLPSDIVATASFLSGRGSTRSFLRADSNLEFYSIPLPYQGASLGTDSVFLELKMVFFDDSLTITKTLPVEFLPPIELDLRIKNGTAAKGFAGTSTALLLEELLPVNQDTLFHAIANLHFAGADTSFTIRNLFVNSNWSTAERTDLNLLFPIHNGIPVGNYVLIVDGYVQADGTYIQISDDTLGSIDIDSLPTVNIGLPEDFPGEIRAGETYRLPIRIHSGFKDTVRLYPPVIDVQLHNPLFGNFVIFRTPFLKSEILPGMTEFITVPMEIPINFEGIPFEIRCQLSYIHPYIYGDIRYTETISTDWVVSAAPTLQIVSLDATAPNAPNVNTGQAFQLSCGIANLSDAPVTNVLLRLTSDGESSYDSSLIVANLPAFDTTYVVLDIVASKQSTSGEIFRVDIIEPVDSDLPPVDNTALIIISRPPLVNVSAFLSGAAGGIVTTGSEFSLVIDMRNNGEGEIDTAIFSLESNVFLGVTNPFISPIVVGQSPTIAFTAPDSPQTITLSFRFLTPPIDRNTGLPAEVINGEFTLDLDVANNRDPLLFVEGQEADGNLFSAGAMQSLARFRIVNEGPLSLGPIATKSLSIRFKDADGTALHPNTLFETGSLRIADSSGEVATGSIVQGNVHFNFSSFTVSPSESRVITFSGVLKQLLPGRFSALVTTADISAELSSGPFIGQLVDVRAPSGDTVLAEVYIGGGDDFTNSLRVKSNPINPLNEPAEFRFLPPANGSVQFTIQSLTGEIVYERSISPEELASASPFVIVQWDGRTSRGEFVRTGVYVVSITSESGDQQGKVRVAVVK